MVVACAVLSYIYRVCLRITSVLMNIIYEVQYALGYAWIVELYTAGIIRLNGRHVIIKIESKSSACFYN